MAFPIVKGMIKILALNLHSQGYGCQKPGHTLPSIFFRSTTPSFPSRRYFDWFPQNIRKIVEEIVAKEKSDIHLALVEYRDHPPEDTSFVVREHDFTPSVKTMKSWLDGASADGGEAHMTYNIMRLS